MKTFAGIINEDYAWEITFFNKVRDFADGLTFLDIQVNWDRFLANHTPKFEVMITVLNCVLLETSIYYRHHRDVE